MSAAPTGAVDIELLQRRLHQVNAVMSAHAGAVELLSVSPAGAVRLRFTGMCSGCLFRALTMKGTIEPALLELPGVSSVSAPGARISEEAAARMHRYLGEKRPVTLAPIGSAGDYLAGAM